MLWNIVLDYVFGRVIDSWRTENGSAPPGHNSPSRLGIELDDGGPPLTGSLWADDNFTFAHSVLDAAKMTQDLSYALGDNSLGWKPGSLCLLANRAALRQMQPDVADGFYILDRQGAPLRVPRVVDMTVLGVQVDILRLLYLCRRTPDRHGPEPLLR